MKETILDYLRTIGLILGIVAFVLITSYVINAHSTIYLVVWAIGTIIIGKFAVDKFKKENNIE
jgi:hypothetical protein